MGVRVRSDTPLLLLRGGRRLRTFRIYRIDYSLFFLQEWPIGEIAGEALDCGEGEGKGKGV